MCPLCAHPDPLSLLAGPDRFNGRHTQYQLLRCSACSIVWLYDPPQPAAMGEHYGSDYDRTIAAASQAPDHWIPRRTELSRLKSGGSILDLGCGAGGFLSTMKGPDWKLYGIEMSEGAASMARERCGAEVFVGDVLDAKFPPASFDAITAFNVMEHVYEPREVLARVAEWLKPDGVFYAMMPNIDSAGAHIFRSYWYALELPRHLYHFSPATFKAVAQSAGLQEVSVTAHRELYFEFSFRYVIDNLLSKIGITRTPLARAKEPGLLFKIVRKAFRLTFLPLFTAAASLVGDGETITAVLTRGSAQESNRRQ
ncbi:MAG TPA: class I SAM-dependent methyltransferase [Acidobacteriaceae bacterium]|nr:class I SAM-dependent methyltransferase [Acidobacteriaceae bacterium]